MDNGGADELMFVRVLLGGMEVGRLQVGAMTAVMRRSRRAEASPRSLEQPTAERLSSSEHRVCRHPKAAKVSSLPLRERSPPLTDSCAPTGQRRGSSSSLAFSSSTPSGRSLPCRSTRRAHILPDRKLTPSAGAVRWIKAAVQKTPEWFLTLSPNISSGGKPRSHQPAGEGEARHEGIEDR